MNKLGQPLTQTHRQVTGLDAATPCFSSKKREISTIKLTLLCFIWRLYFLCHCLSSVRKCLLVSIRRLFAFPRIRSSSTFVVFYCGKAIRFFFPVCTTIWLNKQAVFCRGRITLGSTPFHQIRQLKFHSWYHIQFNFD